MIAARQLLIPGGPASVHLRSAEFSLCRRYRYLLVRKWGDGRDMVMFVGLNPSTADETLDDPTVRRCIRYAKDWGFSGMWMTNLFAFRATEPAEMKAEPEPVGPANDSWLRTIAESSNLVVACWGVHGAHLGRADAVRLLLPRKLHYLTLTKEGHPGHPLYLPAALKPKAWEEVAGV